MRNFKKILVLLVVVLAALALFARGDINAFAASTIGNIFTNPGEDCNTEMNISYHMPVGSSGSYVLYTEKSDTTWANQKKAMADKEEYNDAFKQLNTVGDALCKGSVTLRGLTPGTEYMYKVVLEPNESDVHYFKTGDKYFSFIWTSDFHTYGSNRLKANVANVEKCLEINNGADFVLSTGDTIAHGGTYEWWQQLATASYIKNYMFADTLGNHDWMTKVGTTTAQGASHIFWGANHNNPKNGYAGQENICYYFYYGDALFICLNTEEFTQGQHDWCEEVLKNNDAQYKFIFQHYQMIGKTGTYNSTGYKRWVDLCDKYGVDIAFSGNSHVYVRSKSLYDGEVSDSATKGTVYMVAPSSDGDRGESPVELSANVDKMVMNWAGGAYQVANSIVNVTETGIRVRLINKGGEVLDDGFIPTKRTGTRVVKDLTGVDKDAIANGIKLGFENNNYDAPVLTYGAGAYDAVRSVSIIDKDTNETYENVKLVMDASQVRLTNLPLKKKMNLKLAIKFYDNDSKTVEMTFLSSEPYGEITNLAFDSLTGSAAVFKWDETLVSRVVDHVQVLIDGIQIENVSVGTKRVEIPLYKVKGEQTYPVVLNVFSSTNYILDSYQIEYTTPAVATSVEIDYAGESDIMAGERIKLNKIVTPSNACDGFEWSSDDETIARVNQNGEVVGISEGVAIITCKSMIRKSVSSEFMVTVMGTALSDKLTIKAKGGSTSVKVGDTIDLEMLTTEIEDTFTWRSSDESVATVDANGKVTTLKAGTVKIGCYSNEQDDVFATIELTVNASKKGCNSGLKVEGSRATKVATYLVFGVSMLGFALAVACRKRKDN